MKFHHLQFFIYYIWLTCKTANITYKIQIFFFLLLSILWNTVRGQDYNLANTFTVNEGLPSNHIYDITQDNNGFLWIATDNGIAHFDGKYFYNYTVKDGLPSNDVLQVVKENDGTIWINCYKQPPAYFDEINNKFTATTNNKTVNKLSNSLLSVFILPNGGINFYCSEGYVSFKKKKVVLVGSKFCFGTISIKDNNYFFIADTIVLKAGMKTEKYYLKLDKKKIDSIIIIDKNMDYRFRTIKNNSFYRSDLDKTFIRYSKFKLNPLSFTKDSVNFSEKIRWITFTKDKINIIANSGTIYLYDLENLKLLNKVENKIPANVAYTDDKNNLWVGTSNKGLLFYNLNRIKRITFPNDVGQDNFLSIATNEEGDIFTGNYLSQIFKSKTTNQQAFTIPSKNKTMWIRAIMTSEDKIIAIHDEGYSINYQKSKPIYNSAANCKTSLKSAIKLNDSISILGSLYGLWKLNLLNEKYQLLNSPQNRIINLVKKNDSLVYFVANQNVYKYNYNKNQHDKLPFDKIFLKNNPSVIAVANNNLLWIATFKGEIIVLQNEKLLHIIKNEEGLPDNITNIITVNEKVWIASKSGIYVLKYKLEANKLRYTINKLTKADGLTSNVVNQLINHNDTIYATTNAGVSVIPSQIEFNKFEINPTVVAVFIQNKKAPITKVYDLSEKQNEISIQFAGVELSGHFKNLQYTLNTKTNWVNLDGNTLNLSLKGGTNILNVRAVDVNGNISPKILKLKFDVYFPIYKRIWFWVMIIGYVIVITLYIVYRRRLAKQKTLFEQQLALEQQRNKITADLHDEIGSTLSSLQINSTIANQLLDKKSMGTKKVLQKIEQQAELLSDKIGDIIWSMKPGKEEFLPLSSRIKNYVNDILGATDMEYSISIDEKIDTTVTDITMRKNILLFCKEAINNAAKYSKASSLSVVLNEENNQIIILIIDNGIGFDVTKINGNGIGNMQNRITELKGQCEINSQPNSGTTISATFPFVP